MAEAFQYQGSELDVFALARNWKSYYFSHIAKHLRGKVLEVGAGIGTNSVGLTSLNLHSDWIALEPDRSLCEQLKIRLNAVPNSRAAIGNIFSVEPDLKFDCILYIDVLEHIETDFAELAQASAHLEIGGKLIIVSPAHQFLFSAFDRAIGHFRRYNRQTLKAAAPLNLRLQKIYYLDSLGAVLSLLNRFLLNESHPRRNQILFWDRIIIPVSRFIDRLLLFSFGKSIVGIWQKV